jgi:hypothetical protein
MHARAMFRFKDCRFARMSSGRYCLIRDLGLVKGGKGLRHHEVLIAFSLRAALQRIRRAALERFNRTPAQAPDAGLNLRPGLPTASADDASPMKPAIARRSSRSAVAETGVRNSPTPIPQSISS